MSNNIVGSSSISRLWCPIVAGSGIQHVRCTRGALAPTVTLRALRGGIEECAGGYVRVVVDVLTEALACSVGRGRQRCAPVASLLQAHIAPGGADHVQFHPGGREELAALHGACPAGLEGDELGIAAVDSDGFQHSPAIVGVVGPEGEGLCGAAVGEQDADAVACRSSGLEERFERARDPRARGFGLGWGGEDRGDGGGKSETEGKD